MKRLSLIFLVFFYFSLCRSFGQSYPVDNLPVNFSISKSDLRDKIKGGWAGKTIGVTFGAPYEFQYNGTFIQDYQPLIWDPHFLSEKMKNEPGVYDDVYVNLTFVEVLKRLGLNAPLDSLALSFARSGYSLWHANQAARYNILNGIKAPHSGYWKNNPHADDIDFQIESDFIGLMTPGMVNTGTRYGDKVGHIMNYGDGWYGGIYVGALYSFAFILDDINAVIKNALNVIPPQSEFYQCITDVIKWHRQYPDDWKQTWFELQKKWSMDIGCPASTFFAWDIDAKINSAYVTLGLLYGNGDFGRSMELAVRAGQDADCNASTVGGVLGAMKGYDKIPDFWKSGLGSVEDLNFKYTNMSLNNAYDMSYKQALELIAKNAGRIRRDSVMIKVQRPNTVRFEKSFDGIYPIYKKSFVNEIKSDQSVVFKFRGSGFVVLGDAISSTNEGGKIIADLIIDNKRIETVTFPTDFTTRRSSELFWNYDLPEGDHVVEIKNRTTRNDLKLRSGSYIIYSTNSAHPIGGITN